MYIRQYSDTNVSVQESRIYSMISDGLQMSHCSATDKNAQTRLDTLSSGEFFAVSVFIKKLLS